MSGFQLVYEGFDPGQEGLREALTSTANGNSCMRGCAEWEDSDDTHYPGTYAHGIYDRRTTVLGIQPLPNEDLVNLPNGLVLKLRIEGEEPFDLDDVQLLSYRHVYDFHNALLLRELSFRDDQGRETNLRSQRFVSMHRMHQAAIAWDLTPLNWSGSVEVVSAVDGRVVNRGVARYRQLEGRHLDPQGPRIEGRQRRSGGERRRRPSSSSWQSPSVKGCRVTSEGRARRSVSYRRSLDAQIGRSPGSSGLDPAPDAQAWSEEGRRRHDASALSSVPHRFGARISG